MKRGRKPVLSEAENKNLVRLCSLVATDPYRMNAAIQVLLESVNPQDAEWLKTRLRLIGDNSQAERNHG